MSSTASPSSWVALPFFSDHAPILLKLDFFRHHKSYPYKFNHHWLTSADYSDLVHTIWSDPSFHCETNPQLRIVWKLKVLKAHSRSWSKRLRESEAALLINLESEINNLILLSSTTNLSIEDVDTLKRLERDRAHILREEEMRRRLRSRATWLKWGDSNTKYFHSLANHNRNNKQIWSIQSDCGETLREQDSIKAEAVSFFGKLFKANESHLQPKKSGRCESLSEYGIGN